MIAVDCSWKSPPRYFLPSSDIFARVWRAVYHFFARYCGSKTEHGYSFQVDRLSREDARQYLPYVSLAAFAFNGKTKEFAEPLGWSPIAPAELRIDDSDLVPTKYAFFDKNTGLKIALAEKGDQVVIVIPGLLSSAGNASHELARAWESGFKRDPAKVVNVLGGVPYVYREADQCIKTLLAHPRLQSKQVTLIGQCFGGSIASYVALKQQVKAVCLNSLQLGAGLQQAVGSQRLREADQYVTHLFVENDWLTAWKSVACVDRVLSFLRIRTPGNFGKKFLIPSAYSSANKSHGFVLGSLMAYLGYDKRATPRQIFP